MENPLSQQLRTWKCLKNNRLNSNGNQKQKENQWIQWNKQRTNTTGGRIGTRIKALALEIENQVHKALLENNKMAS